MLPNEAVSSLDPPAITSFVRVLQKIRIFDVGKNSQDGLSTSERSTNFGRETQNESIKGRRKVVIFGDYLGGIAEEHGFIDGLWG